MNGSTTQRGRQPSLRYLDPEVLQKIGSLELIAREVVEGLRVGAHRSPLRGFSTEFAHHRPYVPGDSIRHIDWQVYARTERYYTKLYEAETNYDTYLLLDASASMRYGSGAVSKLEYAKYLAASLAYLVLEQRDSVGLAIFDAELRTYVPPSSMMGIINTIDDALRTAEPLPRTDVGAQLHDFAHRIPRRSVVLLFSDLFEPTTGFLDGLDHLRFRKHNVTVFHTLDPYELDFPFKGTWRFRGLENEPELTTQPARIRAAYLENLNNFLQVVRRGCERNRVDYVPANTARPLDVLLAEYLLWRTRTAREGSSIR